MQTQLQFNGAQIAIWVPGETHKGRLVTLFTFFPSFLFSFVSASDSCYLCLVNSLIRASPEPHFDIVRQEKVTAHDTAGIE